MTTEQASAQALTAPLPMRKGKGGGALILITNDDGWQAPGIRALARAVSHLGEVWVVAPDGPRSGAACAITTTRAVSYRQLSAADLPEAAAAGMHWFACSGTPVDCVKLALHGIVPRQPDLLLSGINAGDNASISVHYSGTMGAVLEGCMKGTPSIGFSLYLKRGQRYDEHPVGQDTLDEIGHFCAQVLQRGLPQDVCLNVNIPTDQPFRGWRLARQARGWWSAEWEPEDEAGQGGADAGADAVTGTGTDAATDPGTDTTTDTGAAPIRRFRLTGTFTDLEPDATDTDFAALRAGYCSVVPVTTDTTAHAAMHNLQSSISNLQFK